MPSTNSWIKKKLSKTLPSGNSYNLFTQWRTYFLQATDHDRWQQTDAALKGYQTLIDDIQSFLGTGQASTNETIFLRDDQKGRASKVSFCLQCRITALQYPDEDHWMSLPELMRLKPMFRNFYTFEGVFPVLMREDESSSEIRLLSHDSGLSETLSVDEEEHSFENNCNNNLLPSLPEQSGLSRLTVKILKFGIKNLSKVQDLPYIVVTLRDKDSVHLSTSQVTERASKIEDYHAEFHTRVEIQRYIEKIPKGSAIFFELKSSDRRTIYFSFLTRENFVNAKGFLELYKAPTDFHRKKLVKVSRVKPLYLHVVVTLRRK